MSLINEKYHYVAKGRTAITRRLLRTLVWFVRFASNFTHKARSVLQAACHPELVEALLNSSIKARQGFDKLILTLLPTIARRNNEEDAEGLSVNALDVQ